MELGIVSYGAYVPRFRIKVEDIACVWGKDGTVMSRGLGVNAKSVPGLDEDVVTISVEAARAAMARTDIDPADIGAIYVGSESHPYAVKPSATIVAEAIHATPDLTAADYEFACKAGTAAIQSCMGLVGADMIRYGVAIGADTAQGAPCNPLEYSASAGGGAFVIGREKLIAVINHTCSYTTDTPDFWRREGMRYPSHGERFTGKPAYFKHVSAGAKKLMAKAGTSPEDYDYAIFHQPNGKFPQTAARMLGFSSEQIATGLLSPRIGNTYSGVVPVSLSAVLDIAKPGDRIFIVSYGSGAGSDAFDITVTDLIDEMDRAAAPSVEEIINNYRYIDYAHYSKFRNKIHMEGE